MNYKGSEGKEKVAAEFDHIAVNEEGLLAFQVGGHNLSELDLGPYVEKYKKMLKGGKADEPMVIFSKDRRTALVVFKEA